MTTGREKPRQLEVWDFDDTITNQHVHKLLVTEANRIGEEKGAEARREFLKDENAQWEVVKKAGVRVNDGGTGRLKQHFEESMKSGNTEISIATHSQFPGIVKRFMLDKEIGLGLDPQAVDKMVIVDGLKVPGTTNKNSKIDYIKKEHEARGVSFQNENICLIDDDERNIRSVEMGIKTIRATTQVTHTGPSHFDQLAARAQKTAEAKTEAKTAEVKEEVKAEAKAPEPKEPEVKKEAKREAKAEAKAPEAKGPEVKAEAKTEAKAKAKAPEAKEPEVKKEAKAEASSEKPLPKANFESENLYEVLGVPQNATMKEITKAYHRLALVHHPDKNEGSAESTAIFKKLNAARELLTNPLDRAAYDEKLKAASPKAGPPPGGAPSPEKAEASSQVPQAPPQDRQASSNENDFYSHYYKNSDFSFDASAPPSRGNVQSRHSIGQRDSQYKPHRWGIDPYSRHQILKAILDDLQALKDFIDKNYKNLGDSSFSRAYIDSLPSLPAHLSKVAPGEARLSQHQSQYGAEEQESFRYGIINSCQTRSSSAVNQSVNVVLPKEVEESLKAETNLAESKMYNALTFDVADKVIKNIFTETGCSVKNPPTIKLKIKDSANPSPLELAYMQSAILNNCPCVCKNNKGEELNVTDILKSKNLASDKVSIEQARDHFKQSLESEKKADISIHLR